MELARARRQARGARGRHGAAVRAVAAVRRRGPWGTEKLSRSRGRPSDARVWNLLKADDGERSGEHLQSRPAAPWRPRAPRACRRAQTSTTAAPKTRAERRSGERTRLTTERLRVQILAPRRGGTQAQKNHMCSGHFHISLGRLSARSERMRVAAKPGLDTHEFGRFALRSGRGFHIEQRTVIFIDFDGS